MELQFVIIIMLIAFFLALIGLVVLQILRFKYLDQKSREEEAKSKEELSRMELEKQQLNLELTDAYNKIMKAEDKRMSEKEPDDPESILAIASGILEDVTK